MRNEVPDYIQLETLGPVRQGERILEYDEISLHVASIYNAANLTQESTQAERKAVFIVALGKAIGKGDILTPRSHPEFGWVLATTYAPPVSCRPVLAGSPDDLSAGD